jgi:mRNA interferase MazF
MGSLTRGSVALVPFPFSDLSQTKLRPAIVLADAGRGDWILCQVTSNPYGDRFAISIEGEDFQAGSLRVASFARPGKLFTAHETLLSGEAGRLNPVAFERVRAAVLRVLE